MRKLISFVVIVYAFPLCTIEPKTDPNSLLEDLQGNYVKKEIDDSDDDDTIDDDGENGR